MLVAGAKRHAKEIFELYRILNTLDGICFFDDISNDIDDFLFGKYPIIRNLDDVKNYFADYPEFVIGVGDPKLRKLLADKLLGQGGRMVSIIAKSAYIGSIDVNLGIGLNIMHNVMISNSTNIGTGTLLNAYVSVHHDIDIGRFCEVSPHAVLLGGCSIGDFSFIGSNATILPNIRIGRNVIIGAGAVVTKDIPDNSLAKGVPARVVFRKNL